MLLEALLITFIIWVNIKKYVTTFDVPGAYLHAKMPMGKTILLNLRGYFADIMCEKNPEHKANVR